MDRLTYFLRRTTRQLRGASALSTLSLLTCSVSMTIFAVYALLFGNVRDLTQAWNRRIEVHAFLVDRLGHPEVQELTHRVEALPGVREVRYISKDEALRDVRRTLGDSADFLEGLDSNPFPASLEISLEPRYRHPDHIREIAENVRSLPGVEDVEYGEAWVRKFASILSIVRVGGYLLGFALFVGVVFIVSNTIRLSFLARQEEVNVMRLVGATNTFIKVPFYIEGILMGAASGVLGLALAYAFYLAVSQRIDVSLFLLLGGERFHFFSTAESLGLIALASALGLLGSVFSLTRALRQT
ncbi:MAG: ABC transporter permease [Nitrospirae bacterium]|nr:ABC transporter permease [Nitrospirota bacterium]